MSDYTPTTEEVSGAYNFWLQKCSDETVEEITEKFDRWIAEVKAEERKAERKRLIEVLEEYRSDLYEFADSSARNDGDPAWFIGRASEVESCVALIKGETE